MKKMSILAYSLIAVAVFLLAGAFSTAAAEKPINENCKAAPDGRVEISNLGGSVVVTGWDRPEVAVTGTLGPGAERLDFECGEGRTRIEVVNAKIVKNEIESDLKVSLPKGSAIRIETVTAGIEVSSVSGALELESVSGDIRISGNLRDVEARSTSGEIETSGSASKVEAESVSGTITLQGVKQEARASNVSGDIHVAGGRMKEGEFESVSGDIHFDGDLEPSGRLNAKSVSGAIELLLPAAISAEFKVSTFSGKVENDFRVEAEKEGRRDAGKSFEFSTGGGKARIEIETFSGTMSLKKK